MNPLKIAGVLCCVICLLLSVVLRSNIGILLSLAGLTWVAQWKTAEDKSQRSLGMDIDGKTLLQRLNRLEQEVGELKRRLAEMEHAGSQTEAVPTEQACRLSGSPSRTHPLPKSEIADVWDDEALMAAAARNRQPEAAEDTATTEQPEAVAQAMAAKQPEIIEAAAAIRQPESAAAATAHPRRRIRPAAADAPNPVWNWLMQGNPLLKTGAVVLFLGLAFLLRYIGADLPLPLRYMGVFGVGLAAAVAGQVLQAHRRDYGLTLQGLGMAVMYLTVLAAVKLHPLLPAAAALAVMAALVAAMAYLAVRQDARLMAQAAVLGGIAAPVLVSDGSGSHLALFAYLAVLNGGVAAIAWFKAWRSLNLIGMSGTAMVAVFWGRQFYQPVLFSLAEPFLICHWLLYTLVACFFARHTLEHAPLTGRLARIPDHAPLQRIAHTFAAYGLHIGALDGALLFGSALVSFGLQYQMVRHWPDAAAYCALLWAAVYAAGALYFARLRLDFAVMKQAFAALALLFVTLAVPLALEGAWTVAAWTLQAMLVYAFGLSERQPHTRAAALLVYLLAAWAQLGHLSPVGGGRYVQQGEATATLLQGSVFGALMAVAGGGLVYAAWSRMRRQGSAVWERRAVTAALGFAGAHVLTLPALLWTQPVCVAAYAVLAAAFAWAWRQSLPLSAGFAAATAVLAAAMSATEFIPLQWVTPLALFAAAAWLHTAFRQPETQTDSAAWGEVCGWLVLAAGVTAGSLIIDAGLMRLWPAAEGLAWLLLALLLLAAARWARWHQAAWTAAALLAGVAGRLWLDVFEQSHGVAGNRLIQLALATAAARMVLALLPEQSAQKAVHQVGHVLLPPLFALAWMWYAARLAESYLPAALLPLAWLAVPLGGWWYLAMPRQRPRPFERIYATLHAPAAAAVCIMWLCYSNLAAPPAAGGYLPLLNAIEIGGLAVCWQTLRRLPVWLPDGDWSPRIRQFLPALLLLVLLSGGVMRVWHYYFDLPWRADVLLASFGVQAALSVVWALAAIAAMVAGNRRSDRTQWLAGASLMGVVVLKLFAVELGNSGGLARIVSFIVVGLLLLLVGWFAPVPPKGQTAAAASDTASEKRRR